MIYVDDAAILAAAAAIRYAAIDRTCCYWPDQKTKESDIGHTVMLAWIAPARAAPYTVRGPMTAAKAKRDLGRDLNQVKVTDTHWRIEGYDIYIFAHWEGTHTSRGANIERDGTWITQVGGISEARGWIRKQVGKESCGPGSAER